MAPTLVEWDEFATRQARFAYSCGKKFHEIYHQMKLGWRVYSWEAIAWGIYTGYAEPHPCRLSFDEWAQETAFMLFRLRGLGIRGICNEMKPWFYDEFDGRTFEEDVMDALAAMGICTRFELESDPRFWDEHLDEEMFMVVDARARRLNIQHNVQVRNSCFYGMGVEIK